MEDNTSSTFNYLGEEMLLNQFSILAENIQKALPAGHESSQRIATQVQNLKTKRERWPGKIINVWQNRILPVFSSESITKLNQAHMSTVEEVNESRKKQKESLRADINRKKKQLDDIDTNREKSHDTYQTIHVTCQREMYLHRSNTFEYAQLESKIQAAQDSFQLSMDRLNQNELKLRQELTSIENNFHPIRLLSTQSNQKNLICPKQNSYLGWVPHLDSYQLIQTTKVPPSEEIFRHISFEPETQMTNLPLSIFNLIHFGDTIGATDQILLTMLTIYLKKYKPAVLETLDTKKHNLNAVIETLAFHCTTDMERATVLQKLRDFQRTKSETFASCITRFESLHVFYLQLDQPSEADQIRLLSYQTIKQVTPYLISSKCGHAFGKWVTESLKLGGELSKESIIRTITNLETHPELKLTSPRHLPGFLITTTLNLPPGESEITLNAHLGTTAKTTNPQTNSAIPLSLQTKPPSRPSSSNNQRPRSNSGARKREYDKYGPRYEDNKNKSPSRKSSPSPNRRDNNNVRGRSPSVKSNTTQKPMSRTSSYCAEIDALQYYSIHSKSPAPRRKQSMPSIFKRPLTPNTFEHLKSNYFFKTSGGRFKDVRQDGRCLRCFSKTHRAAACPTYTKPTPIPCKYCWHLFHQSDNCIFYDKEGKTRPSSASRT